MRNETSASLLHPRTGAAPGGLVRAVSTSGTVAPTWDVVEVREVARSSLGRTRTDTLRASSTPRSRWKAHDLVRRGRRSWHSALALHAIDASLTGMRVRWLVSGPDAHDRLGRMMEHGRELHRQFAAEVRLAKDELQKLAEDTERLRREAEEARPPGSIRAATG